MYDVFHTIFPYSFADLVISRSISCSSSILYSNLYLQNLKQRYEKNHFLEAHWIHCKNRLVNNNLYDIYFSV